MIKLFSYEIHNITLYLTGGVIKTNININIASLKLFLISISGILMQVLLMFTPVRYLINYQVFDMINISLIIFNLIPIYPSDGYKILLSLIENMASYRVVVKISFFISFISLIILFLYTKSLIIFISLYIINVRYFVYYPYYLEKFFIERYLYNIKYSKIKMVDSLKNIYKCRKNYIKCDNIYKEEREVLEGKYAKFIDL